MAECSQLSFQLPGLQLPGLIGRRIEGNFQGGNVSSDSGLMNANLGAFLARKQLLRRTRRILFRRVSVYGGASGR
jgi:hypothetical protein